MRLDLRDGDLVGTFACPDAGGPFTPVLTLGGSDGGISELYLSLLVPEGFACLALAYFGTAHLQRSLVEVPIERVERGLQWLAAHPQAAAHDGRVGVIPLERATGPLLLISGGDDRMWPATRICTMAAERMAWHGRADAIRHLNYPEAGHVLVPRKSPPAGVPQMPMMFERGGSVSAADAAHDAAWPQVVAHLRGRGPAA